MEINNILEEVPVLVLFSFIPAIISVIFLVIAAFFESKGREKGVLREETISNQRLAIMVIAFAWALSVAGSLVS